MEDDNILEPETIRQLNPDISDEAVLVKLVEHLIKNTVAPFVDFYVFENAVHVLNDITPNVNELQGCSPEQIWLALEKMADIYSEGSNVREYPELDDEIEAYIKFTFSNEGYKFLPLYFYRDGGEATVTERDYYSKVLSRTQGPFPIIANDDEIAIQAIKLLRIQEYANRSL